MDDLKRKEKAASQEWIGAIKSLLSPLHLPLGPVVPHRWMGLSPLIGCWYPAHRHL